MQPKSHARLARYRHAVGAAVCLAAAPAASEVLGPVSFSGAVDAGYSSSRSGAVSTIQRSYGVSVSASSYIWQPWFATALANLGFTQLSSSSLQGSDTDVVTGRASLDLFPRSRFPFQLFFDSYDSRIQQDDSAAAVGSYYFQSRRYGFSQQYSPQDRRSNYGFTFEQAQQDDDLSGDEPRILDVATLSSSQSFGKHGLTFSGQYFHAYGDEQAEQTTQSVSARHSVRPYDRLSLDNSLSLSSAETSVAQPDGGASHDLSQGSFDLSSLVSWQAKKRPLSLTGNFSLTHYSTADNANLDAYTRNLSGALSGTYRYSPRLSLSGGAGYSLNMAQAVEQRQSYQRGSATYARSGMELAGFGYSWSVNGSLANQSSTSGLDRQDLGAGFSHSLSRTLAAAGGRGIISLNFSESASTALELGADNRPQSSLNHMASLALARPDTSGSTHLSVNVTDTRNFSLEDSAVQTVGASGGTDRQLGRYSAWGANLALNKAWIAVSGAGGTSDSFESSVLTAYYRQRRFLNIWRLDFESSAQMDSQDLLPWGDTEDALHQVRWENRWNYSIGLLSAALSTHWAESGDSETKSFFFRVRRSF